MAKWKPILIRLTPKTHADLRRKLKDVPEKTLAELCRRVLASYAERTTK